MVAAADSGLTVFPRVPREAEARRKVGPIIVVPLARLLDSEVASLSGSIQRGGWRQDALLSILLEGHREEFPS
jgi:hypothetical protein